ncbi:MAG: excalibur calcium-binding domain-containing protein [Deltaproteobacteria bacterium]|nr:excalibur calcium-binding domain-containing protein [Deltaproteobacteria bacterium]
MVKAEDGPIRRSARNYSCVRNQWRLDCDHDRTAPA